MRTVAVVSLKGGTGKTSLALHLAGELGATVADCDPQGSASQWAESGDLEFPVVPLEAGRGAARFQAALETIDAETVVLDCPPELAETAMLAALLADLLLIPATPSALDLWAAQRAVALAQEAREERGDSLPLVSLVPSRLISRTKLAAELPDTLKAFGEPVAPAITQRVAVAAASVEGGLVSPKSPAGREFAALARHVKNRLRRL